MPRLCDKVRPLSRVSRAHAMEDLSEGTACDLVERLAGEGGKLQTQRPGLEPESGLVLSFSLPADGPGPAALLSE